MCKENPFQKQRVSSPIFPMEILVPFFLVLFSTHFQSCCVMNSSPVMEGIKIGNLVSLIKKGKVDDPALDTTFTTFKEFKTGLNSRMTRSRIPKDIMEAFLILSFFAKCTQTTVAFGKFILSTVNTHILTYQGERIIGWAIQDGSINKNHDSITEVKLIGIPTTGDLKKLLPATINSVKSDT